MSLGAIGSIASGLGSIGNVVSNINSWMSGDYTQQSAAQQTYEYGEQAADNALERSKDYYDYTFDKTTPEAMVDLYKEAGLNSALMYSGGASGTSGSTASFQGTGAKADSTDSASRAAMRQQVDTQRKQNELLDAEKENIEADTESKKADTASKDQQGLGQWLENLETEFKRNYNPDYDEYDINEKLTKGGVGSDGNNNFNVSVMKQKRSHERYGDSYYTNYSPATQNMVLDMMNNKQMLANSREENNVKKSMTNANEAITKLNNEKADAIWAELNIASINADSNRIEALAKQLSTMFSTGEYTNWKTWSDLAQSWTEVFTSAYGAKMFGKKVEMYGKQVTSPVKPK